MCRGGAPGPNPGVNRALFSPNHLLRRSAAAGAELRRPAPPHAPPTDLGRQIRVQRSGLDLGSNQLEPLDPDLTAVVRAYRFDLGFLLKRPWVYSK